MYVVERRGLGATSPASTIGALRALIAARLKKLGSYDLFLRDRSVAEWFKDNSAIVHWLVRTPESRARHEESHAFWTHLSDEERKALVATWVELMDAGKKLVGDARVGGIGQGYGPNEPVPPSRAAAAHEWLQAADQFIARFEGTRQKKRVEARATSWHLPDVTKPIRDVAWLLGIGIVGVAAIALVVNRKVLR